MIGSDGRTQSLKPCALTPVTWPDTDADSLEQSQVVLTNKVEN